MAKCLKPLIRVLYVNDDEDDAFLFQDTLSEAGFENALSFIPKDGKEVLPYLIGLLPTLPDVVVLDTKMPGMEGHEVVRDIRANELLNHLPVILVTGSEGYMDMIRERYPDLKVDGVLIKPIAIEPLTEVLEPFSNCVEDV